MSVSEAVEAHLSSHLPERTASDVPQASIASAVAGPRRSTQRSGETTDASADHIVPLRSRRCRSRSTLTHLDACRVAGSGTSEDALSIRHSRANRPSRGRTLGCRPTERTERTHQQPPRGCLEGIPRPRTPGEGTRGSQRHRGTSGAGGVHLRLPSSGCLRDRQSTRAGKRSPATTSAPGESPRDGWATSWAVEGLPPAQSRRVARVVMIAFGALAALVALALLAAVPGRRRPAAAGSSEATGGAAPGTSVGSAAG
jgi:hypothetical protein